MKKKKKKKFDWFLEWRQTRAMFGWLTEHGKAKWTDCELKRSYSLWRHSLFSILIVQSNKRKTGNTTSGWNKSGTFREIIFRGHSKIALTIFGWLIHITPLTYGFRSVLVRRTRCVLFLTYSTSARCNRTRKHASGKVNKSSLVLVPTKPLFGSSRNIKREGTLPDDPNNGWVEDCHAGILSLI